MVVEYSSHNMDQVGDCKNIWNKYYYNYGPCNLYGWL